MRDPDRLGRAPRDGEVVERAAAPRGRAGPVAVVVPEVHRETDELRSFALQEERGDGGVDPSRHGDGDPHGGIIERRGDGVG